MDSIKYGQDDLIWYRAELIAEGVYKYRINITDHNNEHGIYSTHFYAMLNGTHTVMGVDNGIIVP